MALAYLILAHKNPQQVSRLFHAVHRGDNLVILHFDRRAERPLHRLGRELSRRHSNVIVLRSRTILWGGHGIISVQQEAISVALRASTSWSHFVNLSGQDFPIKRGTELDERLREKADASYVSWFDPMKSGLWKNARERLEGYYLWWPWFAALLRVPALGRNLRRMFGWENGVVRVPMFRRRWPDFRYYGGSNHVALSRAACVYITTDPAARRISRWLEHSAFADEIVFQTVLLNSPLASTVVNTNLHLIQFEPHSPHPRVFKQSDFDRLVNSPKFFARKFDEVLEPKILEKLTEYLGAKTRNLSVNGRHTPATAL